MIRIAGALALLVVWMCATWPASAHEWYSGLKSPGGRSCCSGNDCDALPASTHVRMTDSGFDVTIVPGTHKMVTEQRFGREPLVFHYNGHVTNPSPDGQIHACIWHSDLSSKNITCLMLGGTM